MHPAPANRTFYGPEGESAMRELNNGKIPLAGGTWPG